MAITPPPNHEMAKVILDTPVVKCYLTTIPFMLGTGAMHGGCAYVDVSPDHPRFHALRQLVELADCDYEVGSKLDTQAEVTYKRHSDTMVRIGIDNAHAYIRSPAEFEYEARDLLTKVMVFLEATSAPEGVEVIAAPSEKVA
jgi:hypothetical protein